MVKDKSKVKGNEMLSVNLETSAAMLGVAAEDIEVLVKAGRLRGYDICGKIVVRISDLEALVGGKIDDISDVSLDSSDGSRYTVNTDVWDIGYVDGGVDLTMGSIAHVADR